MRFYHKNHLDHVYAVSDKDGKILERYRYSPFGQLEIYSPTEPTSATPPSNPPSAIQEPGTPEFSTPTPTSTCISTGHYHAELGRFISRDPIAEAGGPNLYAFVRNNPLNWWDELGLAPANPALRAECDKIQIEKDNAKIDHNAAKKDYDEAKKNNEDFCPALKKMIEALEKEIAARENGKERIATVMIVDGMMEKRKPGAERDTKRNLKIRKSTLERKRKNTRITVLMIARKRKKGEVNLKKNKQGNY